MGEHGQDVRKGKQITQQMLLEARIYLGNYVTLNLVHEKLLNLFLHSVSVGLFSAILYIRHIMLYICAFSSISKKLA